MVKHFRIGKKGQLSELGGLATALVTVALVLVIGFLILSEFKTNAENSDLVVNATSGDYGEQNFTRDAIIDSQGAVANVPDFLDIIVITVIGALLLGLVSKFGKTSE